MNKKLKPIKHYVVENQDDGQIYTFDVVEMLSEINRDRSGAWTDYTPKDISSLSGVEDALSLTEYKLIGIEF